MSELGLEIIHLLWDQNDNVLGAPSGPVTTECFLCPGNSCGGGMRGLWIDIQVQEILTQTMGG